MSSIINKSDDNFKKPIIPRNKKTHKILSEEKYVEELSKIIERDFFPDLKKLNAQNQFLEAKEKNDFRKLQEIFDKYSGSRSICGSAISTPVTFDTPFSNRTNIDKFQFPHNDNPNDEESISDHHTLDSFLFKYTSEDNESFQKIIDAAEMKLKKKFAKLYEEEELSKKRLCDSLKVPAIENQFDEKSSNKTETWSYKNQNYAMYIPDGVDFTHEEKIRFAKNKPKIEHSNTRLYIDTKANNIKNIADVGKESELTIDDNTINDIASPLMTWGEIEGTPFKLDGSDTPIPHIAGPSFKINKTSRRETLAIELADKAAERSRNQKKQAINTARRNIAASPYIKSLIDRRTSMSPAAKRLASLKFGRVSTDRRNSAASSIVRKFTPSPIIRKSIHHTNKSKVAEENPLNLTDNLLQIPSKRMKASDFF